MNKLWMLFILLSLTVLVSCKKDDPKPEPEPEPEPEEKFEDPATYYKKGTGASAHDLLSDSLYRAVLVNLVHTGSSITQNSADNLKAFLEARLNKPEGIIFQTSVITSPGQSSYTISDIRAIEDANRTIFNNGDTLAVWFFIADGKFSDNGGDTDVLGVAYRNTSMALFMPTVVQYSGGLTQPSRELMEKTILQHEVGHIMGLVNNGSDMQTGHQDEPHGHHCNNEDCLMYWIVENGDALSNVLGFNSVPPLDQNCLNDLAANGGK